MALYSRDVDLLTWNASHYTTLIQIPCQLKCKSVASVIKACIRLLKKTRQAGKTNAANTEA